MISTTIVGVGKVGAALTIALKGTDFTIDDLIGRNSSRRYFLDKPVKQIQDIREISSDLIIISTQDAQIGVAAESLLEKIKGSPVVLHTSGSLSSNVLQRLRSIGCPSGSLHPLVSISDPKLGAEGFRGAYFCIEGDETAVKTAKAIVKTLGGLDFTIETENKTLYHAAAVTAAGHLTALVDIATEMLSKCMLDSSESQKILLPLIRSTVGNLAIQKPEAALTGPFARLEVETFERHAEAISSKCSQQILAIYLLLGERSLEIAARKNPDTKRIGEFRKQIDIVKREVKW